MDLELLVQNLQLEVRELRRRVHVLEGFMKPKHPKNAYQLWCDDVRHTLSVPPKERNSCLSKMWKKISSDEKAPYYERYRKLMEDYRQAMDVYSMSSTDGKLVNDIDIKA